ncbi:sentrin-specific protease 6-like [Haematobia irritans]|uniref:sentrin-specific protease 6-like n=1 Tax=Haematobia irritans TaxID=7368 RepID=UPI003F5034F2
MEWNDLKREDVTDLSNCNDKLSCTLPCKYIRLGTYCFDPLEPVVITSKGIRIVAPLETNPSETFKLHIHKDEVVKVIAHFSAKLSDSMLCFYTLRSCAKYIRSSLQMPDIAQPLDGVTYFSPNGPYHMRKIIIQFQTISDHAKSVIRSIWDFLDEISDIDAQALLQRVAESDRKVPSTKNESESVPTATQLQCSDIRQLLIYPPGKGGISINIEDYMCLATDQYLNDIIIDFYLKWVHDNVIPKTQRERTHIFSTFFYKRLTTFTRHTDKDKNMRQSAAQKRHARVQNWTKNVNIFEKDFIIIPINEHSHWFLAIICFPRLKGPITFDTNVPVELEPTKKTKIKKETAQVTLLSKRDRDTFLSEMYVADDDESERDEAEADDSDIFTDDSDTENYDSSDHQAIKQPLILIFDSLVGTSRSRVVATLRDYLTCEYKAKMADAPLHTFNKDNMPGHCVKVPQQNNFTDCGLYLLQYVEHFFRDPIRDYRIPIKQLANWFDTLTVTKKREDISKLLQKLMNELNGPNNKVMLPEIPFPTLNGQLIESNPEFEEDEMVDEDDDDDVDDKKSEDMDSANDTWKIPIKSNSMTTEYASTIKASSSLPTQRRKIVLKRRSDVVAPGEANAVTQVIQKDQSIMKMRKFEP